MRAACYPRKSRAWSMFGAFSGGAWTVIIVVTFFSFGHQGDDLCSTTSLMQSREPKIAFVTRSFAGDEGRWNGSLYPTMEMFVNRRKYPMTVVLDDESKADHDWGRRLELLNFTVKYEKLPEGDVLDTRPFKGDERKGGLGYTRQLWSTFWLDLYTDADIIGVIDVDNEFYSYMTTENIMDKSGRIYIPHMAHFYLVPYRNDKIALNITPWFDSMSVDTMPKFLYRETFAICRQKLAEAHGVKTFNEAWKKFAYDWICTFNILYMCGLTWEPHRYVLVPWTDPVGVATVASNMIKGLPPIGCCWTFRVNCVARDLLDWDHVTKWCNIGTTFRDKMNITLTHYANVHRELALLPRADYEHKAEMCRRSYQNLTRI